MFYNDIKLRLLWKGQWQSFCGLDCRQILFTASFGRLIHGVLLICAIRNFTPCRRGLEFLNLLLLRFERILLIILCGGGAWQWIFVQNTNNNYWVDYLCMRNKHYISFLTSRVITVCRTTTQNKTNRWKWFIHSPYFRINISHI